jgi:hypothetical protein
MGHVGFAPLGDVPRLVRAPAPNPRLPATPRRVPRLPHLQEDAILIQMVEKIGEKRWPLIAAKLPGRTGKGCSHRWRTYLRPDVKHPHLEPFTEWEAAVIIMGQKEHANNWLCEWLRLPSSAAGGAGIGCQREGERERMRVGCHAMRRA